MADMHFSALPTHRVFGITGAKGQRVLTLLGFAHWHIDGNGLSMPHGKNHHGMVMIRAIGAIDSDYWRDEFGPEVAEAVPKMMPKPDGSFDSFVWREADKRG